MSADPQESRPSIPPFDRRLYPRTRSVRASKIFHRAGLAYAPAETTDLSEGGALLKVHSSRRFDPGDVVDIVVEPKVDPGLIRTRSLIEAVVMRASPLGDDRQYVAVRFARVRQDFTPERLAA